MELSEQVNNSAEVFATKIFVKKKKDFSVRVPLQSYLDTALYSMILLFSTLAVHFLRVCSYVLDRFGSFVERDFCCLLQLWEKPISSTTFTTCIESQERVICRVL